MGRMSKPPIFARVMSPSLTDTIDKVLRPEFMKWIRADYIEKYDSKHRILYLKKNCPAKGSKVEFMSYDQDLATFGGGDRSVVGCDEPPPSDRFSESTARLREADGRVLISMTPVRTNPNIRWLFLDMIEPGKCSVHYGDCMELMNLRFGKEKAKEVYDRISLNWSKEEEMVRRYGKFPVLEGLVWEFKKSLSPWGHLVEDFKIPNDWMIVMAMDYHARTPVHISWMAVSPKDVWYVFKEYASPPGRTDRQIAEDIAEVEESFPTPVYARLVDPSSAHSPNRQEEHATPIRTFGRFRSRGKPIIFRPAVRKVEYGLNCVSERLRFDDQGRAGIYFFKDATPGHQHQLSHYIFGEWNVGGDLKDSKQEPMKKEDHYCDNIRYLASQNFKYSHPQLKLLREAIRRHVSVA
jgi:hypothetical protein